MMHISTSRRRLLTVILSLAAFSYASIVLCAIGQICFKINDPLLSTTLEAEDFPGLSRTADVNTRHSDVITDANTKRSIVQSTRVTQSSRTKGHDLDHVQNRRESHLFQPWSNVPLAQPRHPGQPLFNCSSISRMKIRSKIGHGVAKETFVGEIDGVRVAIKMVTRRMHLVRRCLEKIRRPPGTENSSAGDPRFTADRSKVRRTGAASDDDEELKREARECYVKPTAKLMKEILLSLQLKHNNLISLLGFCVRSEESVSTDLAEHGVISVYELGHRFLLDNLQILPWQTKLRHAIQLADLLDYLHQSPVGPVAITDLTEGNLVMAGAGGGAGGGEGEGAIKLVDLDDFHAQEPECHVVNGTEPQCPLGTPCRRALCEGHNARANLKAANRLLFKRLLFPLGFPDSVVTSLGRLNARLDSLTLTAADLRRELLEVKASLKGYDDL